MSAHREGRVKRAVRSKENTMGTTQRIANFIVGTGYEDIPGKAVETTKTSIIDCLGTCLAGSQDPVGKIISEYVSERGGKPEAGVIAKGFKTCAPEAALANGTMGHALDYDDTSEAFLGHPTTVILPAVMALGQSNKISGKEALLAYIVGYEVGAKLGLGMGPAHYDVGWHATATIGTMAAVAAGAKVLKLDVQKTKIALGIAASFVGGLRQNFGTMTKPLHAGRAAHSGILAVILAKKGVTADQGILEAPFGYANVFKGNGEYNLDRMTENLGNPFAVDSPGSIIKLYPSCRATAGCLDAIIYLVRQHKINSADVVEVECRTSSFTPRVLIHSYPQTALEGKFSMQYCMAIAIIDKAAGLKQFTDDKIRAPKVQELMPKVKYAHPSEMGSTVSGALRGKVEVVVKLRNGIELCHRVDVAKGDPENPLTREEIESKFLDCAQLVLSYQDAKQCLGMVSELDSVGDISELMDLLTQ